SLAKKKKIINQFNSQDEDLASGFPDIHELLLEYNDLYFFGSLGSVVIRWSNRMTLCAGKCTYETGGRCIVSLSEPLLKYRSVKELKETILHELIHAYLFLTSNDRDRNFHGKEFCFHMNRINRMSGLNINIYHNFHDELNYYRRYIWRCDGVCRNHPPYYGYVRRSINRKPGPADSWWNFHKKTCGGCFVKEAKTLPQINNLESLDTKPNGQTSSPNMHQDDILEIIEVSD
ncbi:unnamed protein product, partial [Cryptosporidium hominis]